MSLIPDDIKYTKESEWIKLENDSVGICGITDHAQEMLTDIVFVELPEIDFEVEMGEQVAVVESVKAVSNVYSPVSGRVVDINKELEDSPEMINNDPYETGWILKLEIRHKDELDSLLSAEEYSEHIESEE